MELNFTTYFPFYDSRLPHQPIEIRSNGIVFWNGKEIESSEEFKQAMIEISKIIIAEFNGKNKSFDWQPIETAPKDGTHFFATGLNQYKTNEHRHYCVCFFSEIRGKFTGVGWPIIYDHLTHWAPFQPPEDDPQFSGGIQHHPV